MQQPLDVPDLGPRYRAALDSAITFLLERFEPTAIVVAGSVVRGNPDPGSDLDLFVLHDAPWRQRVQRRFDQVPVEFFVNHPSFVSEYFNSEGARGRPSTAHMLATGHLAMDTDGLMTRFITEAQQLLADGPDVEDDALTFHRYAVAMEFEDAVDVFEHNEDLASLLLHRAAESALRYRFWVERCWQPRNKELLAELATLDPDLTSLARQYYRAANAEQRLVFARKIVLQTTGETGSFDWESPRDPLDEEG